MSFTGIHQGDAASFQQNYQRVWKQFLELLQEIYKQLKDKEVAQKEARSQEDFLLMEDNKVVAGRVGDNFVDDTSPEYWAELKNAIYTREGEVALCAGKAKQIVLNGAVVLQSDDEGKVLINRVFENERILQALGVDKPVRKQVAQDNWKHTGFSESNTEDAWMYEEDEYDIPPSEQAGFFALMDEQRQQSYQPQENAQKAGVNSSISPEKWLEEVFSGQSDDSSEQQKLSIDGSLDENNSRQKQDYLEEFKRAIKEKDNKTFQYLLQSLPKGAKNEAFSQLSDSEKLEAMDLVINQNQPANLEVSSTIIPSTTTLQVDSSTATSSKQNEETGSNKQVEADVLARLAQSVQALSEVVQAQMSPYVQQMQLAQGNPAANISPEAQNAIQQRLAQPNDTSWWGKFKEKAVDVFNSIKDFHQHYSAAQAVKKLYDSNDFSSSLGGTYQTEDYTIQKQGNNYSLADKSGAVVLNFHAINPDIIILARSKSLSEQDKQNLNQLSARQAIQVAPSGAFAPPGTKEASDLERVNQIIDVLSQAAQRTNQTINVEGKNFGYKWEAKPDGSVKIMKKEEGLQGDRILLMKGSKGQYSDMSPRDLLHFEKMLPTIEKMGQQTDKDSAKKGLER